MKDNEKKSILSMYENRWQTYGYSPQSLGWTKGKQDIRFETLLSFFSLENRSILDIGCGFGDLNRTISKKCLNYNYHGIDIHHNFIAKGEEIYGEKNITFECGDCLEIDIPHQYDYGVACGIFNYKFDSIDNYEYIDTILKRMLEVCNRGIALDFLVDNVNFRREHCFYSNLDTILGIVRKYTRNFILRSDYMPFEFAVICFKDDSFEDYDTIFSDYKNERYNY